MITFPCIGCGHQLQIKDYFAGCKVQCPNCKAELTTPGEPERVKPMAEETRRLPVPPALPANLEADEAPVEVVPSAITMADDATLPTDAPPLAVPVEPPRKPKTRPAAKAEPMVAIPGLLEGASAANAIPVTLSPPGLGKDETLAWPEKPASPPLASKADDAPPKAAKPAKPATPAWMDSGSSWTDPRRPAGKDASPKLISVSRSKQRETSGKALGALILGLATFVVPILCAIPAFILALLAWRDIRRQPARLEGKGLAIAAICLAVAGNITLWPFWLIKRQFDHSRNELRVKKNMEDIGRALRNYSSDHGKLPLAMARNEMGELLLSWRVHILPQLGHQALYQEFDLTQGWDSPHNKKLLSKMPAVFASKSRYGDMGPYDTHFRVFAGPDTVFPDNFPMSLFDVMDADSETFLLVEAREAVPWTKPHELVYKRAEGLPKLGASSTAGFYAVTVDGKARFIDQRVDSHMLHSAIQPRDGGFVRFDVGGRVDRDPGPRWDFDRPPIKEPWPVPAPKDGPWIKDKFDKW
jgi:hypothetical protein